MSQDVATLRDKRNQDVAFTRTILDKVHERVLKGELGPNGDGFLPEEREQYERADKNIEAYQKIISEAEKVALREQWSRDSAGVITRNEPGTEVEKATADKKTVSRNASESYQKEFRNYLRGDGAGAEMRALQADSDVAGGFTVPTQQFANQLIQAVHDQVFVLGLATNYTVTRAESLGAPVLSNQMSNANWGTELSVNVGGADTSLQFNKRELRPHPLVQEILVSKKLIRTSAIDVEAIVRDQLAYHFAVPLEQAFLQGDGANKPVGVFSTGAVNVISTARDTVVAGTSANLGSTDADYLIATKFALKGNYWPRASWILNRGTFQQIRQLKDSNSQYLWSPGGFGVGLSNGNPDRLLDFPIYMSEYAPMTSGQNANSTGKNLATDGYSSSLGMVASGYIAICGDFSKYWTATALDLTVQVLTELKAETNQNAYLGRMEVDGMATIAEAFSRLRMKGF